jgi:NAD(P)-dependent dehydrogenase (short-subunit alcohol dehydrogenase family)
MTYLATGSPAPSDLLTMNRSKIIVLAASSDIGAHLTEHYLLGGSEVVGTYRNRTTRVAELENAGARFFPLDINSGEQVNLFAKQLKASGFSWDTLVSAPGLLDPIGPFFSTDFDDWESSVVTNSTAQLRFLHAIHGLRNRTAISKVIFFAGGGTNGPFDNYSAYCIGKLTLIKMTELLDSECPDLQVSIIGTGWVNTKIHQQTLAAGGAAGLNFDKTCQFMDSTGEVGASLETVAECVDWCLSAPRSAVGGRNFSLVYDQWRDPKFIEELVANPNRYKLRRAS